MQAEFRDFFFNQFYEMKEFGCFVTTCGLSQLIQIFRVYLPPLDTVSASAYLIRIIAKFSKALFLGTQCMLDFISC